MIYFCFSRGQEKSKHICQRPMKPCFKQSHALLQFSLARIYFCKIYIIWLYFTAYLSVCSHPENKWSWQWRCVARDCGTWNATAERPQFNELSIRVRAGVKLPLLSSQRAYCRTVLALLRWMMGMFWKPQLCNIWATLMWYIFKTEFM